MVHTTCHAPMALTSCTFLLAKASKKFTKDFSFRA